MWPSRTWCSRTLLRGVQADGEALQAPGARHVAALQLVRRSGELHLGRAVDERGERHLALLLGQVRAEAVGETGAEAHVRVALHVLLSGGAQAVGGRELGRGGAG